MGKYRAAADKIGLGIPGDVPVIGPGQYPAPRTRGRFPGRF